jgi:hypothetical protein
MEPLRVSLSDSCAGGSALASRALHSIRARHHRAHGGKHNSLAGVNRYNNKHHHHQHHHQQQPFQPYLLTATLRGELCDLGALRGEKEQPPPAMSPFENRVLYLFTTDVTEVTERATTAAASCVKSFLSHHGGEAGLAPPEVGGFFASWRLRGKMSSANLHERGASFAVQNGPGNS